MASRALLVGIDAYPAPNELHGCVNDIKDVTAYLTQLAGFKPADIETVTDATATTANILAALETFVAGLTAGDRALFHYSGHGAQMPSRTGHEIDGLDEVICPVDFDWSSKHAIRDDQFNKIFSRVPAGVEFVWISDSCHSGNLTRALLPKGQKAREIYPPREIAEEIEKARKRGVTLTRLTAPAKLHLALISGCKSGQTSADAEINGRYNGAATYYILHELRQHPNAPLTDLVHGVNQALNAARYDQDPQLAGSAEIRGRAFLQGAAVPV